MFKPISSFLFALVLFCLNVIAQEESPDAVFIKRAASMNMMEVELGRVAQQKATDQLIRNFGRTMEKDFENANQKLMGVSVKLGMAPPSKMLDKDRLTVNEYASKASADFDRDYLNFMLIQHNNKIEFFQKAQQEANSSELRQWINGMLTLLKEHAFYAYNVQQKLKNTK
jgi:putative membrane protein